MDINEIGKRIKYARDLRNYTLEYIASDVGVAKSTIQRYERGQIINPKLPVLQSIANCLNVNPAWLAGKDVPMELSDGNQYTKYMSVDSVAFEITGRSLQYSPSIFEAICQSFDELTENITTNITYTNGTDTIKNWRELLRSPNISYDDKATVIKTIIDMVLYNPKENKILFFYTFDNDKQNQITSSKNSELIELLKLSKKLNSTGLNKVIDYASDLTNMDIYLNDKKHDNNITHWLPGHTTFYTDINAANIRTDINIPEDVDTSEDDIMDDKNF